MKAITITAQEFALLNKIAHSLYQPLNGGTPKSFADTHDVWMFDMVETAKEKGVFSSLLKKGLVVWDEGYDINDKMEHTCALTEAGFDVWQSFYKVAA